MRRMNDNSSQLPLELRPQRAASAVKARPRSAVRWSRDDWNAINGVIAKLRRQQARERAGLAVR